MRPPRWFRFPWRGRAAIVAEIEEEIAFHLSRRAVELEAEGCEAVTARRRALAEFGDVIGTRRYCMEQDLAAERRLRWRDRLADLLQDVRVACRRLARQPGLLATAVLTLAVGIGATTAFWTVVYQLVVRPIPFLEGERVAVLWRAVPKSQVRVTPNLSDIDLWKAEAKGFSAVEPVGLSQAVLARADGAELVQARRITSNLLSFMGVRPALGRGFTAGDQADGAAPVAMLGYSLWRTRFGRDPGVIGRRVMIDSAFREIIGVMPPAFDLLPGGYRGEAGLVALPLPAGGDRRLSAHALVRRAPGVSVEAARAELAALDTRLAEADASYREYVTRLDTPRDLIGGRNARTLYILLGAVGLLLVIACANVAHLLLGRVLARQQEHAVRQALGASRSRLLQHGLLEALVVGVLGAAAAMAFAVVILKGLVAFRPPALDRLASVQLSPGAALLALGLGLGTALLSGLLPAWRGADAPAAALLHGSWAAGHRAGTRLREAFLVTEIGLSLTLLIGAGLLARSLWRLGELPIGFEPEGIIAAEVEPPRWRYRSNAVRGAFLTDLAEAIRVLPGVTAVTRASGVPPGTGIMFGGIEIAGRTLAEAEVERFFAYQAVAPDYFLTMGIPIVEGRAFDPRVSGGERDVVIINRGLAQRYWPQGGAVGQWIRVGDGNPFAEIIGIATDVPSLGVGEMRGVLHLYYPLTETSGGTTLIARTAQSPDAFERDLRQAINRADSLVPIERLETIVAKLSRSSATERFTAVLLGGFAGFATVLFAAGLFGVLSQAVALRTREIGVRVALGAAPGRVQRLILRQAARPLVLGVVLGLTGAMLGGKALTALLFGLSARDPATLAGAVGVTVVVALLASWLPARRATRLDPAAVLRE